MPAKREIIIETMTQHLPIIERSILADWLFDGSERAAHSCSLRLQKKGLLHCAAVTTKLIPFEQTLCRHPEETPDFGEVAYRIWKRQRSYRHKRMVVYFASRRAADAFGGWGTDDYRGFAAATHDLLTASFYCKASDEIRASWVGEHRLKMTQSPGDKLADAEFQLHGDTIALETANRYTKNHLAKKHNFYANVREVRYWLI